MSNENKTKVCKHCQSEISKKAKICPQCRKKQGGIVKWIVLVIFAIALIGALAGSDSEDSKESATSTNPVTEQQAESTTDVQEDVTEEAAIEYTVVSVSEMMDVLESNAMKAEATYQDKYVEITGRLGNIDSDGKYIDLMPTDDEWAFIGVTCYLKNDEQRAQVMEMSADDVVTLRGKVTDIGEVLGYYLDIDSIN